MPSSSTYAAAPPVRDEDVARLSPLGHAHLNCLGRYACTSQPPAELRPLRAPVAQRSPRRTSSDRAPPARGSLTGRGIDGQNGHCHAQRAEWAAALRRPVDAVSPRRPRTWRVIGTGGSAELEVVRAVKAGRLVIADPVMASGLELGGRRLASGGEPRIGRVGASVAGPVAELGVEQSAEHGGVGESDLGGDGGDRLGLGGSASNAGNVETTNSQAIINGSLWGEPLACTAPTPAQFTMPAHGSITLTGTITIDGHTYPFNQTMKY